MNLPKIISPPHSAESVRVLIRSALQRHGIADDSQEARKAFSVLRQYDRKDWNEIIEQLIEKNNWVTTTNTQEQDQDQDSDNA